MSSNPRRTALKALLQVEKQGAYLNLLLPKLIEQSGLKDSDAGLAVELAYGTSRMQGFYDWVITEASGRDVSKIDLGALICLRLGAHQLLTLQTPAHAAIFETVELAKSETNEGAARFVNAVLRRVSERDSSQWKKLLERSDFTSEESLAVAHSHPEWIVRAFEQALKSEGRQSELEELLEADNRPPKINLVHLPGKVMSNVTGIEPGLASPIGYTLDSGDPAKVSGIQNGSLRVQDQGSQLVTMALAEIKPIKQNEKWLDLCAGPGGKAVLLAALASQSSATLTTNEVTPHRAQLVSTAIRHSGFSATQLVSDGRQLSPKEKFDRIMLDAPCLGLGSLRRRPESRWTKSVSDLKELTSLQRELLQAAWNYLKPDGVLAYVTCSPHLSETTAQIEWFLRMNQDAKLLDSSQTLRGLNPKLELAPGRKTSQLWPHRNGTDAMFLAILEKGSGKA